MGEYAIYILKINVLAAACILMVLFISRFVKKTYSSHWKYIIWLCVAVFLLFPVNIFGKTAIIKLELPQKILTADIAEPYHGHIENEKMDVSVSDIPGKPAGNQNSAKSSVITGISSFTLEGVLKGFLSIWFIGIACLSLCRILSYLFSIRRLFRWCVPVQDADTLRLYQSVCVKENIHTPPKLMTSPKLPGPLLAGLKTTCLYLPDSTYTHAELKLIFNHELNHYRHKDLWYKVLLLMVKTIYWFNPVITLMVKEAEKDIEYICDSRVVEHCSSLESSLYNRLLLKTAAAQSHIHYLSASLNDSTTSFKERITYMRKAKFLKKGIIPAILLITTLIVSNMLVACTGSSDNAASDSTGKTEISETQNMENTTLKEKPEEEETQKQTQTLPKKPDTTEKPSEEQTEKPTVKQTEQPTEAATETDKKAVTQTEDQLITEKPLAKPDPVSAKYQIYEGTYQDARWFGDNVRPDNSPSICKLVISNVTDTSFDFSVHEINLDTQADNVIFMTHTAEFIGDGTKAAYYGNEYTLNFTFPDDHSALPAITDIQVSGFSPLEGFTYVNNGVPGHEFS